MISMTRMKKTLIAPLAATLLTLAGCVSGPGDTFDPNAFEETGRVVTLNAQVVDLAGQELYPGLKANLWAFCFTPSDPNDEYSAKAIEPREPLPGDITPSGFEPGQCGVPGPTIRVRQGDRVIVNFAHSHFHPHTIHWHGQTVDNEDDGVPGVTQDTVASGGSYTYDFIAKKAGTLWYHCHVDTQFHVMQGLYGMLIVEPQDTSWEPEDIDKEYQLIFSTMRRDRLEASPGTALHNHPAGCASGFPGCENPYTNVDPDVFLINGHSFPFTEEDPSSMLMVSEGERIRIRILNAGTEVETVHLHGHDMLVTHKDGNPVTRNPPQYVDTLNVAPGERFDVVVEANNPGAWVYHSHVNDHETNCGKTIGGMHSMLAYKGYEDKMHAYKAELPATCPYDSQLKAPNDYMDARVFQFGTNTTASASFQFPIELQCAVRSMKFGVELTTVGTLGRALTDLEVVLTAPSGDVLARFPLGGREGPTAGNVTFDKKAIAKLVEGNYTASIAGQAFESSVAASVMVDYYEDLEDTRPVHSLYGYAGCRGYT